MDSLMNEILLIEIEIENKLQLDNLKEVSKDDEFLKLILENYNPKIIIRDLIDIKIEYEIYLIANVSKSLRTPSVYFINKI